MNKLQVEEEGGKLFLPPYPDKGSKWKKAWWNLSVNFLAQNRQECERVVLSMLEYNPDAKLLDLGCADGKFTKRMAEKVGTSRVFGIDRLEMNVKEGIIRYLGNLNKTFPVPDEEFDVVCASLVIEHLNNTDGFLREIHRVLKPGGYTVISTDNLASLHNIVYLIFGRQPTLCSVSDEMNLTFKRPAHRRIFTIFALTELLEYHRFEIEKAKGTSYYPLPISFARVMCRIDKWHSRTITVQARKKG